MRDAFHRRRVLLGGLAVGAATYLPSVRAHEYFAPNFTVIHPWTRATQPSASSAIVSLTIEDVSEADRLIGVSTSVAQSAEAGGQGTGPALDIEIPKGQKTELSESGVFVRLLGLKMPLEIGREYPLTLIFAKAGAVPAKLLVDF